VRHVGREGGGVMGGGVSGGGERSVLHSQPKARVARLIGVREIGASLQHRGQTGRHLEASTQEN
jgi:hypothetical protein